MTALYQQVQTDCNGVVLVEGLHDWIEKLQEISYNPKDGFYRLKDNETGAEFLVKRVK